MFRVRQDIFAGYAKNSLYERTERTRTVFPCSAMNQYTCGFFGFCLGHKTQSISKNFLKSRIMGSRRIGPYHITMCICCCIKLMFQKSFMWCNLRRQPFRRCADRNSRPDLTARPSSPAYPPKSRKL